MTTLQVFVKSCSEATGWLEIDRGGSVTAHIPVRNHKNLIRIQKKFAGWKVELSRAHPGFGKPYLVLLTNENKGDLIKLSIVPQQDFVRTYLNDCKFKSVQHFTLVGPNISTRRSQIDKTTSGMKLELESYGTLRISSHPLQIKEVSARVVPKEGCNDFCDLYVDKGAVLRCRSIEVDLANRGVVFINGTVTSRSCGGGKCLTIKINSGELHIGIDGVLGQEVNATGIAKNENLTKKLEIVISHGNLTNFGTLCAQNYLTLTCNSIMLCSDSKHDTAQRGFSSFISLQKDLGFLSDITQRPKTSSSLNDSRILQAVKMLDSSNFVFVVNEEVDPAAKINGRSIASEFNMMCGEWKDDFDKDKCEKEVIRGGLVTCKWRHGVIRSSSISCIVKEDIHDCSQLQGKKIHFHVGGSVTVVKPWTWLCGNVSGLVRGDFLFFDNAILERFDQLYVLRNVRIFETSIVWTRMGGKLHTGEVFENKSSVVSDGDLALDLGQLKQGSEASMISKGDLLLAFRDGVEKSWFGHVLVLQHFFIQLEKKVSCDAFCIAKECDAEFFERDAQLLVNHTFVVEEGSLNLKATDVSQVTNFIVLGELHAEGINGITASVCTRSGAVVDLKCSPKNRPKQNTIDVITRCLEISADSVMSCNGPQDKENKGIFGNSNVANNVSSEDVISVNGNLTAFGTLLNIQSKAFNNSGMVKLSPASTHISSEASLLSINCKEEIVNTGVIECNGNMHLKSENLSNERGILKSANMDVAINSNDAATLGGRIYVDKYFIVSSQSQNALSFSALGGKDESNEGFVLPDQFEVRCVKGRLLIDSAIAKSEDIRVEPECIFRLCKCLKLRKECDLGQFMVEFHGSEDIVSKEMNKSVLSVEDSLQASRLWCAAANTPMKERLSIEGPNKITIIHEIKVDESIEEVVFDTINPLKSFHASLDCRLAVIQCQIECVDITAKALHILGRLRCTQPATREKPSTIIVEDMISLTGSLECVGSVEVSVGKSFEQEQAESGSIDILQRLKILTEENGTVSLKGLTKGKLDSLTLLEIEAHNINISGSLTEVSAVKIVADKDLHLTRESKINSCESVEINGEWITTAGSIEEFSHLQIQPWAIVNSGQIESVREACDITLSSDLALVNSGICRSQVTSLEAPFLLSLPGEEIADVNDVTKCELVGRDNIKLESITCFLGGSALKSSKRIENNTVLLFKFLAYVACIPDAKSVEAWSKAGEWLKNIQKEYEASKDSQSSESLRSLSRGSMQNAEISLRLDQMYNMVNNFVAEVLKNGIESFDVQKLVFIITSESERYTKINVLKEKLLAIPRKARKMRELIKKRGMKAFKSMKERFGFSESKKKSNQEDGIHESGSYCFGEGVTFTDSFYEALFDEVFCDNGAQFAGDVAVVSKEIFLSKREKRAIAMLLCADEVCSVGDIASSSLEMKSSRGKVQLVGKVEADQATIEAKSGIDLAYHDKREGRVKADHKFKSITMKTNKINEVNSFLKGEGVYEDLKISDQLGLVVTDQDVVLSSCNLYHGYGLNLKARSVNIDNSSLRFDKGASISSDQTLNVSGSSVTSQNSVLLKSVEGNVNLDSSSLGAGGVAALVSSKGSVSMAASSVSGEEGAVVKAKKDVIIDVGETRHSTSSSDRGFFSSSKDVTSYSIVSKSSISSSSGSVSIESEEGKIKATATEIQAAKNIAISAKEDVVIQDKVTVREEEHVRSNWFRKKRTRQRTDEQHRSSLNAGGSLTILSRDSNVTTIGTDYSVSGDMMLQAAGTVLCEDRILSQSKDVQSSGFSFSVENGLSLGEKSERMMQQRLAGRTMKVGGNLSVSAKNFDVKNAMGMDVGNMIIDTENVNFEGAQLINSYSCKEWSIGFGIQSPGTVNVTSANACSKQKQIVNQGITVRGRTHFTAAQNVNLTACNLETGAITGNIENLHVISKQSEIEAFEKTTSVGFAIGPRFPIPEKFSCSENSEVGKFVEKASGIHCSGPIKEEDFKVGSINLKGSSVTADADIGNFAKKIISEKVSSYRSQSSFGLSLGVNKTGVDVGLSTSKKSMAMEHQGTIASSSGIVSEEIKRSVNTDYSKHARITDIRKSAFGLNLRVAKDGVGAGIQVNDTGAGVFASKEKVGGHVQCGDKGFALSGGTSGVSGSLQNGENSIGLGLSKEQLDINVKSKDSAIGTSLGKRGISGSVQHKNFAMGGSLSKQSKSIQMSAGEFNAGLSREKNSATGEKTTRAAVKVKEFGLSGSTSKHCRAIDLSAGDVKTGFKREKDSKTGEKTTSANVQVADLKLAGSTSKYSKSLDFAAGDVKTGFKREKNSETGEKSTSANVQVADLKLAGSTSKHSKSLDFAAGDVKTGFKREKDSKTGEKTTSANVQVADLKLAGSTSKHSKSVDFAAGDVKTGFKREKNSETGEKTTSANVQVADLKLAGSTSKHSKSLDFAAGDVKAGFKREENSKTGEKTTSANVQVADLKLAGSTSTHSQSLDFAAGDVKTGFKREKNSETGEKTTSANVQVADLKLAGSTSKHSKSLDFAAGDVKAGFKQEKNSKTGEKTTSANVQVADLKLAGSTSKHSKSLDFAAGDVKAGFKQEKNSKTGEKTTSANVQVADLKLAGSTSKHSKSVDFAAGNVKTGFKREKNSETGEKTTSANVQVADLKLAGSTSKHSKSLDFAAGDVKAGFKREENSKTGEKTTSANVQVADLKLAGSTSKHSKSLDFAAGDVKAGFKREENSKTGEKTTSANVQVADLKLAGSRSKHSKSLDFAAGDVKAGFKREENSKTGEKTTSANVQVADLKLAGSTSKHSKSLDFAAGDVKAGFKREENSKTGEKTTSANVQVADLKLAGSTSKHSKSLDFAAGDVKAGFKREENSKTGEKTTSANVQVADLKLAGSTSRHSQSLDFAAGDVKTGFKQHTNALTGETTTSADFKVADFELAGSTSENSKSLVVKAGDVTTGVQQQTNALTGETTTSARFKAADFELACSTSENSKSLVMKAGDVTTGVQQKTNALTRETTTSAGFKAADFELAGSTSENAKSLVVKAGDVTTGVQQQTNALTGETTTSAGFKAVDFDLAGSTSENYKSLVIKAGDVTTGVQQKRNTLTGETTTSAGFQAVDFELAGSTSENSKSLVIKAGDVTTGVHQKTNAQTGETTTSAGFKGADFELTGSTSENSKSLVMTAGDVRTGVQQQRNALTGETKTSTGFKAGDFKLAGSTSENSKSLVMKAGDVTTGVQQQTNALTGETTTSAGFKAADFELAGSTAENSKSLVMKAGGVKTGVQQQTNALTGETTTSAGFKASNFDFAGSTSENSKSLVMKAGDVTTGAQQQTNALTGETTTSAECKGADFELACSTSENSKSLVMKAGDVTTGVQQH
ncbi:pneumococcal serine-rich repeat protein-like [Montipora foliosa]|uniref:pneumococcal serine-rich repeat protein-like n=1 Tax=Montipora foliosa TaxID=591990 RepID=UPI0035F186B7